MLSIKKSSDVFMCLYICGPVHPKRLFLVFFNGLRINTFLCSITTFQHTSNPTEIMEAKRIPEVILNSGKKMPVIGLGTASVPPPPHETLTSILIDAFDIGYRHFDTASLYGSEEPLGRAVEKALELGLVKSRDEVFITSKLWSSDAHPDLVLPALKTSLQ